MKWEEFRMEKIKHGYAVASLVLGILSIVLGCCWQIGIVLGIVGLILAIVAKKSGNTESICTAGLVLCIIGTAFGVIAMLTALLGAEAFSISEINKYIKKR